MEPRPIAVNGSQITHFFTSAAHRLTLIGDIVIAVAFLAVLVYIALAVASRFRRPDLSSVLEPYRLTPGSGEFAEGPEPVLTVPLLSTAAARVEGPVGRTALGRWLENALARAGSRIHVGELLTIWLIGGAILAFFGWILSGWVGLSLFLVLALCVPMVVLQGFAEHRSRLFAAQLPDVLKLTASSLRGGFSLVQGLDSVTRQVREPSKTELSRVLAEARLGRPIEDALESAAARIRNPDFTESVLAVRIQQESGGNLAGLFDTLADTMIQRTRMRREVRALTAEGRLSAYILGILPLALGLFIFFIDRSYMMVLFHTFGGKILLVGGLLLELVGFYWMYRTVKIET